MLKHQVLRILFIVVLCTAPLASYGATSIIRTKTGVSYEIPDGWTWTEFDGYKPIVRPSGAAATGATPNEFAISSRNDYGKDYDSGWDSVDRDEQRSYPSGVKAHWKAGKRFGMHYAFLGEAAIGNRGIQVSILDSRTPTIDVKLIGAAFELIAKTLKNVPESTRIYHPSLGFSSEPLEEKLWYNKFGSTNIDYNCWGKETNGTAWISVYPGASFDSVEMALADITGYMEKKEQLKIGKVQRVSISKGELLWTEQPESKRTILAALRKDGKYYFLSTYVGSPGTCKREPSKADILAVAKSLRPWDGK